MCYVLEAEVILANILNEKTKYVTNAQLYDFIEAMGKELPEVYLDINMNSLGAAAEYNPKYFIFNENDCISLNKNAIEDFKNGKVKHYFNSMITVQNKQTIISALSNYQFG